MLMRQEGFTPLHIAAFNGHHKIVALLINEGANTKARDAVCLHLSIKSKKKLY